jgi:cell division protein FtsW (lipid II flippase)
MIPRDTENNAMDWIELTQDRFQRREFHKMIPRETENNAMDWIKLTQDRFQRREFAKTVMKIWNHKSI